MIRAEKTVLAADNTLRGIRRRRGLTLAAAAGRAGISVDYLSMLWLLLRLQCDEYLKSRHGTAPEGGGLAI